MPDPSIDVVLGFDFGMRHIGVAVGQTITNSATALSVIKAKDGIPDWDIIGEFIQTWRAKALVVGIPYNMDGSEQELTKLAEKFSRRLKERFQLPVYTVDERLTTFAAKQSLQNKNDAKKPHRLDSVAAKIIVESWLEQQID